MSNLFFWIIILSFLIPMGMRMYRKSVAKRNQDQTFQGRYPNQFGSTGAQSNQPRDGYTQQDYYGGGFRQFDPPQPIDNPQPLPNQFGQPPAPYQGFPGQQFPSQPGQQFPGQPGEPYPGQSYPGQGYPNQPLPTQPDAQRPAPEPPAAPSTPPPPSAPQGFRARKLAELDQQYTDGKLSMEEYMSRRGEIMKG
ncbi:hypothetical protein PSET11_02397 [Arthrobacter ulcerisalmonis]|uniref:SHOCT domain-containing protein n=1 Tax=Arthrobacter ulcerisalmonis TaxID=2483813 RepID=A0A3P5XN85_9MICC|nr:hypothetical protein [Arthrobacter ulcerisalmonis]VDC30171.1 hypothetical protein PSET11_02397 [Arthrobacter ulcerisalmonis]